MDPVPTKARVLPDIRGEKPRIKLLSADSNKTWTQVLADENQTHTDDLRFSQIRRLVVLVPNSEVDEEEIARQIWELASRSGLAVLFFSLCPDIIDEPSIQRRMITLASLTHEPRVIVDTHIEYGNNLMSGIKRILDSGDVIVCGAEQRFWFSRSPLYRTLEATHVPVWTLDGLYSTTTVRSWLSEVIFWVVSVAILLGFFWLQIQIVQLSNIWVQNIYLILTVMVEVGLLWGWHLASSR